MHIKDIEYKNIKNILQSVVVTMIYIFNFSLYYFTYSTHHSTYVYKRICNISITSIVTFATAYILILVKVTKTLHYLCNIMNILAA